MLIQPYTTKWAEGFIKLKNEFDKALSGTDRSN